MYESERRVLDAAVKSRAAVKSMVQAQMMKRYDELVSWDDAALDAFVDAILPLVDLGTTKYTDITNAYLDQLAGLAGVPYPNKPEPVPYPRGDQREVYSRPILQARYTYSKTKNLEEAKAAGLQRLMDLIDIDLQLAETHTAREWMRMNPQGVVGYRRVLTGAENCALCVVASTQRYHTSELRPIHRACDCITAPIMGRSDPGRVINAQRIKEVPDDLMKQIAEKRAADSGKSPILVREHGEYGPVLTWRDQQFKGPSDIP